MPAALHTRCMERQGVGRSTLPTAVVSALRKEQCSSQMKMSRWDLCNVYVVLPPAGLPLPLFVLRFCVWVCPCVPL